MALLTVLQIAVLSSLILCLPTSAAEVTPGANIALGHPYTMEPEPIPTRSLNVWTARQGIPS